MRTNAVWTSALEANDPEAIGDLRSYLVRGLGAALRAKGIAGDLIVEDVVQEALLVILDRLDRFEGRSRFTTWAMAIAIRGAMTELRRKRWQDRSWDAMVEESSFEPASLKAAGQEAAASVAQSAARSELLDALADVIDRDLTDKQRSAILAELGGMPQVAVAEHLGTNRNALYKLTHDARRRLRQGLETAGFSAGDLAAWT